MPGGKCLVSVTVLVYVFCLKVTHVKHVMLFAGILIPQL